MVGDKEILWQGIYEQEFKSLLKSILACTEVKTSGLIFKTQPLRMNIKYDNPEFEKMLQEKFILSEPFKNVPALTFLKYNPMFGFDLPYRHYGYVSRETDNALVFAASFGVLKSVISGYASLFASRNGYVPIHGSVFSVDQKGVILTGGTKAGKTTVLINLAELIRKDGKSVKILTDDWAIVRKHRECYIAETFDPSISLREVNLRENPHIKFRNHESLARLINERIKISVEPSELYDIETSVEKVRVDLVILLKPEPGEDKLQTIKKNIFASEVVDAAYHYPYISDYQVAQHRFFWEEMVSGVKFFSFFTRHSKGGFQSIEDIRRIL